MYDIEYVAMTYSKRVHVHVQGPQAYAQDTLQPLRLIVRPCVVF